MGYDVNISEGDHIYPTLGWISEGRRVVREGGEGGG